jgi:alpha-tubulin suppressor-like RCC1 family protein
VRLVAALAIGAVGCGRIAFEPAGTAGGDPDAPGDIGTPVDAVPGCGAKLGGGRLHMCAISSARELWCWGDNVMGQIGDGSSGADHLTPTRVTSVGPVIDVAGGRFETCVAQADGIAKCWGEGTSGQLGNGMDLSSTLPVEVTTLTETVDVAASSVHACALGMDGDLWCWGEGADGRLGLGTTTSSNTPQQITTLPAIATLSSGGSTSCAIARTGGELWCWGYNQTGEVGNGTTGLILAPVRNLIPAALLSSLRDNTGCAVLPDRRTACWGRGDRGQLGNGVFGNSPSPVMVMNLADTVEIGVGIDHVCALRSDGTVACWGDNAVGQLGRSSPAMSNVPLDVAGLTGIATIASTAFTSCAATVDGVVRCWGRGVDGELGDGMAVSSPTPVTVLDLCP